MTLNGTTVADSEHSSGVDMAWHTRPALQPNFAPLRRYLSDCRLPSATPFKLTSRIAFIGDETLCADLMQFAEVTPLHPDRSDGAPADVLLIGGDWPRAGDPWREALLAASPAAIARLRAAIAAYKARGIPSVLWVTGEADTTNAFAHLRDAVDVVFAAGPGGLDGAAVLEQGVNVKRFNPLKDDAAAFREDAPYFRFVIDGAYELSEFLARDEAFELIRPLLDYNTWLVDSTYHYQSPNMKLHPACRRRFLGHVDENALAHLMKMAHGLFLPSPLLQKRPCYAQRRAREAAACKTLTFSDGPSRESITGFDSPAALAALLHHLQNDTVGRMAQAHLAWRNVLSEHTLFERLETILTAVGVAAAYNAPRHPSINIVIPTIRPEMLAFALEMARRQTYAETCITVVVNGGSVPKDIVRAIGETPNAKLCFVPGDKTIGYCMNAGINRQGTDYWTKWDDDDIYGPHYLEDQMLQRKYVDFDVAGKAAIFNYIEAQDAVFLRNLHARDSHARHVGGGTLLVKNASRHFAEDGRGGEDKAFLHLSQERGDCIVAGDPFNFVQVRRSDLSSHTWTLGAHAHDLSGPRRAGLNLATIIQ